MTRITLFLAQGPGLPDGDLTDRLILNLELNGQGQVDVAAYDAAREPWLATHDVAGKAPRSLEIIRIDEGWALQSTSSQDDPIWTFDGQVYRPGELVMIQRPDGEQLLFRIVASERAETPD